MEEQHGNSYLNDIVQELNNVEVLVNQGDEVDWDLVRKRIISYASNYKDSMVYKFLDNFRNDIRQEAEVLLHYLEVYPNG